MRVASRGFGRAAPRRVRVVAVAFVAGAAVLTFGRGAAAAPETHASGETVADRTAVRFVTPETGGNAKPRFLTEREVAFFARVEAMMEQAAVSTDEVPERFVRTAIDRLVARKMLASLLLQRGSEPPDLQRLVADARADLEARVGGPAVLEGALRREGLDETELAAFLRDQMRAAWYVDRAITPIGAVTEDALREAFRGGIHPFRGMKFEEARVRFQRWLTVERLRASEIEFLQSARARVRIVSVEK